MKYRGIKTIGMNGTPAFNFGDIWVLGEDGFYTSEGFPGRKLTEIDIQHDVANGYLELVRDGN